MLVVDRVVLHPSSSRARCGNSNVVVPAGPSRTETPATKSFRSGTCASTLAPRTRSACPRSSHQPLREFAAEELDERRHAAFLRRFRHVRGRVDPEHRNPLRQEVLQQVAVVRRELDDEAVGREPETVDDHLDVATRVLDPGVRVGREVGVLLEDLRRRDERRQLGEPAALADPDVEREERLHRIEPVGRQEALAKRRLAEVDHRQLERCPTEAAVRSTGTCRR